ncbi:MAG: anaerobic selenocysteine-containing dehydrogenase [Halieaceae bacterium]|jgi:anaerobic selenocysteine-containing dehydrogenase
MNQLHHRTCHLCETMCGIEIEHDGEQVIAIRGDKNDVLSQGNICPKATGIQDIHTCEDRLRKPLKRVRKNPDEKSHDDEWEEVEWEEAIDYAAGGLARIQNQYGKDSLGLYFGRSTAHNIGTLLAVTPVQKIIGSRNIYTGSTVDQMPHNFVWHHMLGHQFLCTIPDINRTDYYLMLGTNPKVSNGAQMSTGANTWKKLNAIRARGGKCVLIDPRRTESAKYMDEHHFIRPHADSMLLIGIVQTIFAKGLARPGRMAGHINDWDKIKPLMNQFDMDRIAEITTISREDIERIAEEFATAKSAVCYGRTGISMVQFAGLTQWLMQVLNVIVGGMDEIGGMMFPKPAIESLPLTQSSWNNYRSRVSGRPEFSGEFPMAILGEEILTPGEGQIRALIGLAGNMVLSMADGHNSEKALQALEFYVAVDPYLNETTRFADIILPPCGPLEKGHYDMFYHLYDTINWSKYSPALFTTEYSKWTDFEIFTELMGSFAAMRTKSTIKKFFINCAHKLIRKVLTVERIVAIGLRFGPYGKGLNPFKKDALSLQKLKDNPHGVFLGDLEYSFPAGLYTEDKKINLTPQVFIDDLPRLKAYFVDGGMETEQAASEFDLKIISRLTNRTLGWMHHSYRLVKGKNPCELMMHPMDAAARNIGADSVVAVTSRTGQIQMPVLITEEVMPGVVCMPHLWGHNRKNTRQRVANANPGVSMNDITDVTGMDQLTGNAIVNGVPVKVEPVDKVSNAQTTPEDETVEEYVA